MHLLVALVALLPSHTQSTCITDPTVDSCESFKYAGAGEDVTSLCSDMPEMVGCSFRQLCDNNTDAFCHPMSLLGDICLIDGMSGMKGCASYNTLCATGTKVRQCQTLGPLPHIPTTGATSQDALKMCQLMPSMGPCETCNASSCPDPFKALSTMCLEHRDFIQTITECADWVAMCSNTNSVVFLQSAVGVAICGVVNVTGDACVGLQGGLGPLDPACASYLYPNATKDLSTLCTAMPNMVGCSIARMCDGSAAGPCNPFSLLGDICVKDPGMSGMPGCESIVSMCRTGTKVLQCSTYAPLLNALGTMQLTQDVLEMCHTMPDMPACPQCTSEAHCPDPLKTMSAMCLTHTMSECSGWQSMCNSNPDLIKSTAGPELCGKAGASALPMMLMYFHQGITEFILFKQWVTRTDSQYFGVLFFILLVAISNSLVKAVRHEWELSLDDECSMSLSPISNPSLDTIPCAHDPPSMISVSELPLCHSVGSPSVAIQMDMQPCHVCGSQAECPCERTEDKDVCNQACSSRPNQITTIVGYHTANHARQWLPNKRQFKHNLIRGAFVFFNTLVDYALMLLVMTFNLGIFLAVCAGIALGTVIFGHRLSFNPNSQPCCD